MTTPVNSVVPAIGGTVLVSALLACSTGTWSDADSYSYQWKRIEEGDLAAESIPDAINNSYIVSAEDVGHTLFCDVTATSAAGQTATASTAPTIEVPDDYFVSEDGTGLDDANSLCPLEFADSYFAVRNQTAWTKVDHGLRKSALVRATDYIETRFGMRFRGEKQFPDVQVLSWPRSCVELANGVKIAEDAVPAGILKAASEYALRALTGALAPDPVMDESGRALAGKSERVGPISESVTYASTGAGSVPAIFKPYPAADILIKPFLNYAGALVRT